MKKGEWLKGKMKKKNGKEAKYKRQREEKVEMGEGRKKEK